jgi:hypothetical protein
MRRPTLIILSCLWSFLTSAQNTLPLWNFDSLDFKGTYNRFERAPSSASIYLTDSVYNGKGGKSLRINACKATEGFCGAWINFFFTHKNVKRYIHAGTFNYLSFYIKGATGGEQVQVQLADKALSEREDSRTVKPLSHYLPNGITTRWQQVLIPLSDAESLDRNLLAGLTFNFTTPGCHEIYVDDICLKQSPADVTPLTTYPNVDRINQSIENAMWVWQTYKLFNHLPYREKFFSYCERLNVKHVYMQLFYDNNLTTLLYTDSLKSLAAGCYERGIRVYGLDGAPEWGLYEKHEVPLTVVKLISAYNASAAYKEKLAGAHFDIEPYLLLGFNDPELRRQIIYENLDLKKKLSMLCASNQLVFGLDIPFWYEDTDSSGLAVTHIEFNNKAQAVSYHMIDMAGQVAIMGYRNFTYGSDGMINKDLSEIRYASNRPDKSIWAGVETITETPGAFILFSGIRRSELNLFLRSHQQVISRTSRFKGFRLLLLEHDAYVSFGLEKPTKSDRNTKKKHRKAMSELHQLLLQFPSEANREEVSSSLIEYLNTKPEEWQIRKVRQKTPVTRLETIYSPLETNTKLSFQAKGLQDMLREVYSAAPVFLMYPAFKGFAFHCFESLILLNDK